MEETTHQAEEDIQNLLRTFEGNREKLHQNKQRKLHEVTALHEELEEKLRKAAQATKTEIEKVHSELQIEVERRIATLRKEFTCLQKSKENVKQSLINPAQFFVASKLQKKTLASALSKHKNVQDAMIYQRIEVKYNDKLRTMLSQHQYLGTVNKTLMFKENESLNIRHSKETETCDIKGICIMEDGSIVVSDNSHNKSVKAIDPCTKIITSHFSLSSAPWGLCHVKSKDIVVCLPKDECTKMLTVDAKQMSVINTVKLGFYCLCVSHHDDILYVTDLTTVFRCDMEGNIMNKFQTDLNKQVQFRSIYALTVNRFNGYIYIGDCSDNGTIVLDVTGKVVNRIPKSDLDRPSGLCSGDAGNIFVCGLNSRKILRLSMIGDNLGSIIEGLYAPQAVCFDSMCGRLYVSNYNRDDVLVYDAQK